MSEQVTIQTHETSKVIYSSIQELITEWQVSGQDCSIWEYLGIPEYVFKDWASKCRAGVIDA